MAWCKLEDTFRHHPKFKFLARELGVSRAEARGFVAGLWSWSLTNAADGELTDFDPDEIAAACDCDLDPTLLLSALISARLVDKHRKTLVIHDWMQRAGSYKKAKQKQRERQKTRESESDLSRDSRQTRGGARGEERRGEERRGEEQRDGRDDDDATAATRLYDEVSSLSLTPQESEPVWNNGDPIRSASDLRQAIEQWGWAVNGQPATLLGRLSRILKAGHIEPHEVEHARVACHDGVTNKPLYFLGTVEGQRRTAQHEASQPSAPPTSNNQSYYDQILSKTEYAYDDDGEAPVHDEDEST